MTVTIVLGFVLFALGLILDSLNIAWGFQSARGKAFRSGIILIPLILYALGSLALWHERGIRFIMVIIVVMLVVHALCYQLLPWVFDLLFQRKHGAAGGR